MKLKILQIVDVPDWAINRLASRVVEYNDHFDWDVHFLHPKMLEAGQIDLEPVRKAIAWCDVIDANYWRSLSQLADKIPELKDKTVMLTHHNEKDIFSADWSYVDIHVAPTNYIENALKEKYPNAKIVKIYNAYDPLEMQYQDQLQQAVKDEKPAFGYVGRVVPWKGLKEIARAAYELGYPLMFMGKIDKPSYWAEIPEEHHANIDLTYMECDDEERVEFYKHISCYVGFSGSGRETGPLGVMDAMACGVPVITTPCGICADVCEDDVNALVVDFDDYDGLKEQMQRMIESAQLQQRLRSAAWDTIRNFTHYRRALHYRHIFNEIVRKQSGHEMVSIITPYTANRIPQVDELMLALNQMEYGNFELVLVCDEEVPSFPAVVATNYPVKIHCTFKNGYNLAMARNIGVIEADGKYLMFNDSRLLPEPDAIRIFVNELKSKERDRVWLFGSKGYEKTHFVENFSFVKRADLINGGMFNERVTGYGGMSQELRERFMAQGFDLCFVSDAKSKEMMTAKKDTNRRSEIIKMKELLFKMYDN